MSDNGNNMRRTVGLLLQDRRPVRDEQAARKLWPQQAVSLTYPPPHFLRLHRLTMRAPVKARCRTHPRRRVRSAGVVGASLRCGWLASGAAYFCRYVASARCERLSTVMRMTEPWPEGLCAPLPG